MIKDDFVKSLLMELDLKWNVYKNYHFLEKNNKTYITTDFSEDNIKYFYYPNEYRQESKKRKLLFVEFAEANPEKEVALNLIKKYGFLKTSVQYNHKKNNNEFKDESLDDIILEIKALKKAWQIYKALLDKNYFSELKKIIKFKEIGLVKDPDNKKIITKKQIIVEPILKSDPSTFMGFDKNEKYDYSTIYQISAMKYLVDTISNNIRINGGAIPSSLAVYVTDADTDEIWNCSFVPNLECNNLAAALWIQFYNFITSGPDFVKCKNERCDVVFLKKGKQEYHNEKCKAAQNMRDYWKHLKIKQMRFFLLLAIFKKTNNFSRLIMEYYKYCFEHKTKKKENAE